ncbi:MAG: isochorismatase family protein [Bacteroidales bacterium]|nr:isochorismatase family protein [Bacteroidales bacterium]
MKEQYFTKDNISMKSLDIKNNVLKYSRKNELSLKSEKLVLLVTDMQEFFLKPESHAFILSADAIINNINLLIKTCEKLDVSVILTQHINNKENAGMMDVRWSDLITEENPLSRISDKIICTDPIVFKKTQYDAFYKTGLENFLRKHNKTQIIICGVMTNLCCETTARSAFVRGFEIFMPIDTTAAYNFDFHLGTIQNLSYGFCQPVLSDEIIEQLKK